MTGPVQKVYGTGAAFSFGGSTLFGGGGGGSGQIFYFFAKSTSYLTVLSLLQHIGKLSYGTLSSFV